MLLNIAVRTVIYHPCCRVYAWAASVVGQITPFDLTLLVLLSNSVQNALTGPDLLGCARIQKNASHRFRRAGRPSLHRPGLISSA